jgi:hypothetical protein
MRAKSLVIRPLFHICVTPVFALDLLFPGVDP